MGISERTQVRSSNLRQLRVHIEGFSDAQGHRCARLLGAVLWTVLETAYDGARCGLGGRNSCDDILTAEDRSSAHVGILDCQVLYGGDLNLSPEPPQGMPGTRGRKIRGELSKASQKKKREFALWISSNTAEFPRLPAEFPRWPAGFPRWPARFPHWSAGCIRGLARDSPEECLRSI